MTIERKNTLAQAALTALITIVFALVALFAYNAIAPSPEQGVGSLGLAVERITHPVTFQRAVVFDASAPVTVNGDLSVKNITVATAVIIGGTYVGITPVATATAINTPTPITALNALAVRTAAALSVAGTPVIPFATAQSYGGTTPVADHCVSGVLAAVIGSATVPAALFMATPQSVQVSLGADATGDTARVTYTNAAGVVTLKTWNTALTPAPATTAVPITWTICGQP